MIIDYAPTWTQPDTSWQMKLDRAAEHIVALRAEVATYRATKPIKVVPDDAPVGGRLAYRLRYSQPVPPRIKVILADALNNLRVATENLAFELAQRSKAKPLTERQESASTFPICATPDQFANFFQHKERIGLYNDAAIEAFRLVQPFTDLDEMKAHGVDPGRTYEDHAKWDELYRLNRVWNIDKHRRQAGLMWWPDMFWWTAQSESKRSLQVGDRSLAEGSVIFYIVGEDEGMGTSVTSEFNLCFIDDPAFVGPGGAKQDVVSLVESWHARVAGTVFPKIYSVMSRPEPVAA